MKRWRSVIAIGIILSFFITFNNKVESNIPEKIPLQSNITDVTWRSHSYYPLNEDHSHFEFIFYYDILNPTNETVTIYYTGYPFSGNIDISFYGRSYNYYNSAPGGVFQSEVKRNIYPGTTSENVTYMLSFEKKGLTMLPDGLYEMWITCLDPREHVDANHTTKEIINHQSLNLSIEKIPIYLASIFALILFFQLRNLKKINLLY